MYAILRRWYWRNIKNPNIGHERSNHIFIDSSIYLSPCHADRSTHVWIVEKYRENLLIDTWYRVLVL